MITKRIGSPIEAGEIIKQGGLVAFPTETVYGLGADMYNETAVKNIFKAKGRPGDNPLILHVPDYESILPLVHPSAEQLELLKKVYDKFCPAPLTFILPKSDIVPLYITGRRDTVAIRVPNNKIALEFLKSADVPIPAPSANISGTPSPTTAEHVWNDLSGKIDAILEGPNCEAGLESTIIDLTTNKILRYGAITEEMLREVMPELEEYKGSGEAIAPGLKYRHYAPKAPLIIFEGKYEKGEKNVIISKDKYDGIINLYSGKNDKEYAHNLFSLFRKCDEIGAEKIYIVPPSSNNGIAKGINARINKAISSYNEVIISERDNEDISQFIEDKIMGKVLLAKIGSEIVGVLEYLENDNEVEILNIEVIKKRKGTGTALVNALPKKQTFLEVRVSNNEARSFYKGLGFIEQSIRKKYYADSEDAILCYRG